MDIEKMSWWDVAKALAASRGEDVPISIMHVYRKDVIDMCKWGLVNKDAEVIAPGVKVGPHVCIYRGRVRNLPPPFNACINQSLWGWPLSFCLSLYSYYPQSYDNPFIYLTPDVCALHLQVSINEGYGKTFTLTGPQTVKQVWLVRRMLILYMHIAHLVTPSSSVLSPASLYILRIPLSLLLHR